jgi:hypothetical protein
MDFSAYMACYFETLIDYLMFYARAQEYFTYMETSPLPVKGCKI